MLDHNGIAERRLAGQQLLATELDQPGGVVSWLGAIQAQDYAGTKWSIGLRLRGSSDSIIEQAISDGSIARTWAMRGTLHFTALEDVHWLLALLAPRVIAKNARRYRQLELDEPTLARSSVVLARALEGGKRMDRQALQPALEEAGLSTTGQRLFYMLQRAALDRLICQGTAPKNKPLYRQLAPPGAPQRLMDREEALAELATRYFSSRGPATLDDFVWWSGLLVADAKTALAGAKSELVQEKIGARTYWSAAAAPAPIDHSPEIMLLPGFDEFLLSYRDRSAALDAQYAEAWSKGKAMFSPSIIRRGKVIGLWKRAVKKRVIEITPDLFTDLTAGENRALEDAAQAYGRFLGKPALLRQT